MARRTVTRLGRVVLGVLVASAAPVAAADDFAFYHEGVLGTSLELHVRAEAEPAARRAERRVLDEIERLRAIFSTYDPASELSRFQALPAGREMPASPELAGVWAEAERWRRATGGAFDPRAGALGPIWRDAARTGRLPTGAALQAARTRMAPKAGRLVDPAGLTLQRLSDSPLTLDAIAKGFIVERACRAAAGAGVRGVVLNLGGDLRVVGDRPQTVAIAPARGDSDSDSTSAEPLALVAVRDRSIATSGSSRRGFLVGSRWFSHILDPRTGRPADGVAQATVIAPDGATADALATAFNVMDPADALRLADATPEVACLIVAADGRIERSRRWAAYEVLAPKRAEGGGDDTPAAGASWGEAFELALNFEINRPPAATKGYRRPYVVIWAEDETGRTVRTLVYWVSLGGQGPDRWLPDLSRWYRDDPGLSMAEKKNMVFTTARPTRSPGQYNVIWDGKDAAGRPLPAGPYTLSIEAAREHGTHQLMRKTLTLADRPFVEELKGDVEIKSATLTYRRKPEAK